MRSTLALQLLHKAMQLLVIFGLLLAGGCAVALRPQRDKIFLLQDPSGNENRTLIVVTWSEERDDVPGCEIFTDKMLVEEFLVTFNNYTILRPSKEDMVELMDECSLFSLKRRRRQAPDDPGEEPGKDEPEKPEEPVTESSGNDGWNVIFPGTKWCGSGDIAKNYDDLGFHQDTDRCCRAHDLCDDLLSAGETRNNLTNKSLFTKLSCKCDNDFYNCLDRVNSVTSNTVGNTYFNVLRRECYAEDYPLTKKCKKYKTFLKLICIEYKRDTTAPKVYQWIPAKRYKKLPIPGPLTITLPF